MNNSKPNPAAPNVPHRAQPTNARHADARHVDDRPAVITTDFSARPFGRCGLLPPGHRVATPNAPVSTASQTTRRTG